VQKLNNRRDITAAERANRLPSRVANSDNDSDNDDVDNQALGDIDWSMSLLVGLSGAKSTHWLQLKLRMSLFILRVVGAKGEENKLNCTVSQAGLGLSFIESAGTVYYSLSQLNQYSE
jgi:hypothetical protein